jgi:hypothetical protein
MRIFSGWRAEADGFGAMVARDCLDGIECLKRSDSLREATLDMKKGERVETEKDEGE